MLKSKKKVIVWFLIATIIVLSTPITASASAIDTEQVAYINNSAWKSYLQNNDGTADSTAGLISALGDTIRWTITPLSDGTCTIRSVSNPNLYLAGSARQYGTDVRLLDLPTSIACKWEITLAPDGSGCLIRNVYTSKYLNIDSAGTLKCYNNLHDVGTVSYEREVWRIAEGAEFYGNDSSYTYRELPSNFTFKTLVMFSGDSGIIPKPSNAFKDVLWSTADEFSFAYESNDRFSIDSSTGAFTATSVSGLYFARITATHLVTGRTVQLELVINPVCVGVGIPDDSGGHDHSSALYAIEEHLLNCGYSQMQKIVRNRTVGEIDANLDSAIINVFVSRSHGGIVPDANGNANGTCLFLNQSSSVVYSSNRSIRTLELSNLKLAVFVGCKTGAGGRNGNNLPAVAVEQGAMTAIGFEEDIPCNQSNMWTVAFFEQLASGKSVSAACKEVASLEEITNASLERPVICGYKYSRLTSD